MVHSSKSAQPLDLLGDASRHCPAVSDEPVNSEVWPHQLTLGNIVAMGDTRRDDEADGDALTQPRNRGPASRRSEEVDQLPAHNLWLFLLRPVTGPVDQSHSPEVREPVLAGSLGASRDSVGAPILFARNEQRGDVNGPPG